MEIQEESKDAINTTSGLLDVAGIIYFYFLLLTLRRLFPIWLIYELSRRFKFKVGPGVLYFGSEVAAVPFECLLKINIHK